MCRAIVRFLAYRIVTAGFVTDFDIRDEGRSCVDKHIMSREFLHLPGFLGGMILPDTDMV